MITTETLDQLLAPTGRVLYWPLEHSVETDGAEGISGCGTLLLNDLNLQLDDDNCIRSIWGFLPSSDLRVGKVSPPPFFVGRVRVNVPVVAGTSKRLTQLGNFWPVTGDEESGWMHIGESVDPERSVQVLDGLIIGVRRDVIVGVWLKPVRMQPA